MEAGSVMTHEPGNTHLSIGLFLLTFSTGLIDAASFIALGHVFTANMTGNVVFLAFAVAGVPGLSFPRSLASLAAFMIGAVIGGRLNLHFGKGGRQRCINAAAAGETLLLVLAVIGVMWARNPSDQVGTHVAYAVIVLTALAMGIRNAVVRKLAIPDLTTTVLTLTVTGLAAESSLAGGNNQRWFTRTAAILTMFVGAFTGAILLRYGLVAPLAVSALLPVVFVGLLWLKPNLGPLQD